MNILQISALISFSTLETKEEKGTEPNHRSCESTSSERSNMVFSAEVTSSIMSVDYELRTPRAPRLTKLIGQRVLRGETSTSNFIYSISPSQI